MDFFAQQDAARKRTRRLVAGFVVAVLGVIVTLNLAAALAFSLLKEHAARDRQDTVSHAFLRAVGPLHDGPGGFDPELVLLVTFATGLVITLGSSVKTHQLARGGPAVATLLGGRPLTAAGASPPQKRLLNIVEEMAIASGTSVPAVYLLEDENSINAFAAGFTPNDAVIGVTRGCMELLSRDELQGVIAHEFSHIFNGDMRLNMRLACLSHGILFIGLIGRFLFTLPFRASRHIRVSSTSGRGSSKGGGPWQAILVLMAIGLILMAIGSVGYLFSLLLKSAVSREREYLADAAAVQFTRNPEGIAGALKKIGGLILGSKITSPHAPEASHFFFANGLTLSWFGLLASHPPLNERIRRIDPQFDGTFPKVKPAAPLPIFEPSVRERLRQAARNAPQTCGGPVSAFATPQPGQPTPRHLYFAAALTASLPDAALMNIQEPHGARALVYALLLGEDQTIRSNQLALLENTGEPGLATHVTSLRSALQDHLGGHRLPLIDLAIPTLRQLSPAQFQQFQSTARALIEADQGISLFEYSVLKIILRHLEPAFHQPPPPRVTHQSLLPLLPHIECLLGAIAWLEADDEPAATAAFVTGVRELNLAAPTPPALPPPEDCGLEAVDQALNELASLAPTLKKNVLYACGRCALHNHQFSPREGELLRAIADAMDVPLPPFLQAEYAGSSNAIPS